MSTAAAPLHAQQCTGCRFSSLVFGRAGVLGGFLWAAFLSVGSVLLCLRWPWTNLHSCCPIGLIICPTGLFCLDSEYVVTLVRGLECDVPHAWPRVHRIQVHLAALRTEQEARAARCPVAGFSRPGAVPHGPLAGPGGARGSVGKSTVTWAAAPHLPVHVSAALVSRLLDPASQGLIPQERLLL